MVFTVKVRQCLHCWMCIYRPTLITKPFLASVALTMYTPGTFNIPYQQICNGEESDGIALQGSSVEPLCNHVKSPVPAAKHAVASRGVSVRAPGTNCAWHDGAVDRQSRVTMICARQGKIVVLI